MPISNGELSKTTRLRGVLLSLMSFIAASKYEGDAHVAFYRYCWPANVGKSSLFTALTKKTGFAANYPFATIEPNTGMVPVPDYRLDELAKIDHPAKIVPATVEFVDIAGLVAGASQGEGLGNKFLANIRETDAICEVVRFFSDPNVEHVSKKVDPQSDVETIKTELVLADIATVDKALPRLEKEAKRDKSLMLKFETAKKVLAGLNEGHRVLTLGLSR